MIESSHTIVDFDPNLIKIGPIAIRWYALAYITGLVLGWRYMVFLLRKERLWTANNAPAMEGAAPGAPASPRHIDDLLVWAALGVILGGRLGYVLIYGIGYCGFAGTDNPACYAPGGENLAIHYLTHPWKILMIWEGGMAFHGGLLGVVLAIILFARRNGLDMVRLGDLAAVATPIGLFFGRIANFINGELWGKATDAPWGMIFASELRSRGLDPERMTAEQLAPFVRHPSQLYEAALEGLVLFLALYVLTHYFGLLRRRGLATGLFLVGYGIARAVSEIYRDSEAHLFSPDSGITMGMLLSLPMWLAGAFFLWLAFRPNALETVARPGAATGGDGAGEAKKSGGKSSKPGGKARPRKA